MGIYWLAKIFPSVPAKKPLPRILIVAFVLNNLISVLIYAGDLRCDGPRRARRSQAAVRGRCVWQACGFSLFQESGFHLDSFCLLRQEAFDVVLDATLKKTEATGTEAHEEMRYVFSLWPSPTLISTFLWLQVLGAPDPALPIFCRHILLNLT
jgi:hypothetical protein